MRSDRPVGEWMALKDAAKWYGVNEVTIYRLLRRGRLSRNKRDGDKRTYLNVDELEQRFRPHPVE